MFSTDLLNTRKILCKILQNNRLFLTVFCEDESEVSDAPLHLLTVHLNLGQDIWQLLVDSLDGNCDLELGLVLSVTLVMWRIWSESLKSWQQLRLSLLLINKSPLNGIQLKNMVENCWSWFSRRICLLFVQFFSKVLDVADVATMNLMNSFQFSWPVPICNYCRY